MYSRQFQDFARVGHVLQCPDNAGRIDRVDHLAFPEFDLEDKRKGPTTFQSVLWPII